MIELSKQSRGAVALRFYRDAREWCGLVWWWCYDVGFGREERAVLVWESDGRTKGMGEIRGRQRNSGTSNRTEQF